LPDMQTPLDPSVFLLSIRRTYFLNRQMLNKLQIFKRRNG